MATLAPTVPGDFAADHAIEARSNTFQNLGRTLNHEAGHAGFDAARLDEGQHPFHVPGNDALSRQYQTGAGTTRFANALGPLMRRLELERDIKSGRLEDGSPEHDGEEQHRPSDAQGKLHALA